MTVFTITPDRAATTLFRVLKSWGEVHTDTARSLKNLGGLLQAIGDLAGARPYYAQALAILEQVYPTNHPNLLIVRGNLESLEEEIKSRNNPDGV
jgi:Flp pilus assembly protein TadD